METALLIILPIVTGGCGIAAFFIARYSNAHKKGQDDGSMKADITYIKRRVDDVLLEQKETNRVLDIHAERITRLEESSKSAHKRIDTLEDKVSRYPTKKE